LLGSTTTWAMPFFALVIFLDRVSFAWNKSVQTASAELGSQAQVTTHSFLVEM
jgi:hypothetical protein